MLGNFSVADMEKRTGVSFPTDLVEFMNKNRQENISIPLAEGEWHCFDIPFTLFCYDRKMAQFIYDFLEPLSSEMKGRLEIAIQN
jgi:hypothetical protein